MRLHLHAFLRRMLLKLVAHVGQLLPLYLRRLPESRTKSICEIIHAHESLLDLRRGRQQAQPRPRVIQLGGRMAHSSFDQGQKRFVNLAYTFGAPHKVAGD